MILLGRLVPLVTISALVAGAPGAHAAKDVSRDPAGDLMVLQDQTPAPHAKSGDITKLTTDHGAKVLTLTTSFVERTDEFVGWRIVTPQHQYFVGLNIFGLPQPEAGTLGIRDEQTGKDVTCRHLARVALPGSSTSIRVRVPRKCLGSPRWVRVGSIASYTVDGVQYADDARRDGAASQLKVRVGPKVKAG